MIGGVGTEAAGLLRQSGFALVSARQTPPPLVAAGFSPPRTKVRKRETMGGQDDWRSRRCVWP
jgi:hypothetical protein